MSMGIFSTSRLVSLSSVMGLLAFFLTGSVLADGGRIVIDGKSNRRIPQGAAAHKSLGTIWKRRGDVQRFIVTNNTGITWINVRAGFGETPIGAGNPGAYEVRIPPSSTIGPFGETSFTDAYLGGAVPPGTTFAFISGVNQANPLDGFFCFFFIDDTPKKRKGIYNTVTKDLKIRDASGTHRVPDTPMRMAMPLGRGAFNGEFMGRTTNVFPANTTIQGRVHRAQFRQGGDKILLSGKWRWRLNRNALPLGRAIGRFNRWTVQQDAKGVTTLSGNIRVSNTKVEKSAKYSLFGRFRGPLTDGGGP